MPRFDTVAKLPFEPPESAGQCFPLGTAIRPGAVNFSVFSKNCTALELLLFDRADDPAPARVICFDPERNRTFYYWHMLVPGLKAGQLYGYRAHGPHQPEAGMRFDGTKVLVDPYSWAVIGPSYSRQAALRPGCNAAQCLKSVVVDPRGYNWEGDHPLRRPLAETVIAELHVGGFTRHPSSGVTPEKRGTFAGLIDKIPYLKELGITAVELLPVQQFDDQDAPHGLRNYWGYSPIAFFAPHRGYSSRPDPIGPVHEFRDMVKALHRAGIEVILDVVFNHTAEGDHGGPTLSFRGLENSVYYMLQANRARYANYSGCGNTLKGNHSIVRRLIVDCLHYWVRDMHVDGFRFDLASVLSRGEDGQVLVEPPILWEIESDPVLAGTKIIAEAWDSSGLYQVGSFVGSRWAEWNGQFRDDLRRFVKGEPGTVLTLARRLTGSPDLFEEREVQRSINFVTCHDGFTLADLVSYNRKHNDTNLEGNCDGAEANHSWNCGAEGPSTDLAIVQLRDRQAKNLLCLLFLSQGTPMLLMGDEVRRSLRGNNNAYCQDNDLNWFDWSSLPNHADLQRFVQGLLNFRRHHPAFREPHGWQVTGRLVWHGVQLNEPDWGYDSHSLAFNLCGDEGGEALHVLINAWWQPLTFQLPPGRWSRLIDTSLASPEDIAEPAAAPAVHLDHYRAEVRSVVVLVDRGV